MNAEIAAARERFLRDTVAHEMTILRDDGLYRHLRFQKPETVIYRFDLITWPGYLAIVGDAGDYLFARVRDMFEFFAPNGARGGFEDSKWGINPGYWSEKLQAPSPDAAETYSREMFCARVGEWFEEIARDLDAVGAETLRDALRYQLLDRADEIFDEREAHAILGGFEHEGRRIVDSWEWSLREYDHRFLWCCWAIVWGISQYEARVTADTGWGRG